LLALHFGAATAVGRLAGPSPLAPVKGVGDTITIVIVILNTICTAISIKVTDCVGHELVAAGSERAPVHSILHAVVVLVLVLDVILTAVAIEVRSKP